MHILVMPVPHGLRHQRDQFLTHRIVGKTLTQVDRPELGRQRAHHGKYGCPDIG